MPQMYPEAAQTNLINVDSPEYQAKIKASLLALSQKMHIGAGNGIPVSQQQLSVYLDQLQSLIPLPQETAKRTLSDEVREWALSSEGDWLVTDVARELHLVTRSDRKNLNQILGRLVKENVIARTGERRGKYRTIDHSMAPMDWENADVSNTVDLILPLGLHKLMKLYPKNIIVVAGDTNAGKTAYLLNLVRENAENFKINYFTNDLTPEETKVRIGRFAEAGMNTDPFKLCNFIPRIGNFLDVINPDGITIIDYLKLTDKFWLVAKEIDLIYERLQKGVAIIAIQKDTNATMGRGGDFAAEAARLYFTLEKGRANVIKMKNLVDPKRDPNGKSVKFDMWGGCKFIPDLLKGWHDTPKKYGGSGKKKQAPEQQERQPGEDDAQLPF